MIFNCLGCGIAISSKKNNCPYCKSNNVETIEALSQKTPKQEKLIWREKMKGTILSYVLRNT